MKPDGTTPDKTPNGVENEGESPAGAKEAPTQQLVASQIPPGTYVVQVVPGQTQPSTSPVPAAPGKAPATAVAVPGKRASEPAADPSKKKQAEDEHVKTGPKRRRWLWPVAIAVAVLILVLLLSRGCKHEAGDKSGNASASAGKGGKGGAARAVPVMAAAARTGDMGVYLTGLGTATALNTVTVHSRVDGELIKVHFTEGQIVHEGDLLAEIDPRPFQVQLMQAEGQQAKDEAALRNANTDLERYRVLMQQDAIPRQQLDTQASLVNQFEAALKSDQSQIESAKLNIVYSRITAPLTGRVGLRLVDAGNIVHANDPNGLLVITQLQPISVIFTVPADQLPKVMQQMKTGRRLPVDAYDRDLKNKLASGSLLAVDNQIDQTTGTVRLKALFGNEDMALFPNQFVNARLLVDTISKTVIVPTAAIQRSPQSTYVYVVKPDESVDMRPVDVQLTEADESAIRKGVGDGELVVVDGIDKLQPGTKVSVGRADAKGGKKAAS